MTDEALAAFCLEKGWTGLNVSTPRALGWEQFGVKNYDTGISMFTTAPTKVEAAALMVMRLSGLAPAPSSGTMEALKAALVSLTYQLKADL